MAAADQLTLMSYEGAHSVSTEIEQLVRRWVGETGEGAHLEVAKRATQARFIEWGARALDRRERQRLAAYFGAVVRRNTMRASDRRTLEARRRLVIATIEADLRAAGWDAQRARDEALRATRSGCVAEEVA